MDWVFIFIHLPSIFLMSVVISSLTHELGDVLFNFYKFVSFPNSYLLLISNFVPL